MSKTYTDCSSCDSPALADSHLCEDCQENLMSELAADIQKRLMNILNIDDTAAALAVNDLMANFSIEKRMAESSFFDLEGIAPNATGKLTSEEFVSRLRKEKDNDSGQ